MAGGAYMAITFDKSTKTFYLDGKDMTYVFYVDNHGYLEHLYFGKRIGHDLLLYTRRIDTGTGECTLPGIFERVGICNYNQMGSELTFSGTGDFRESCVHVKNPAGDRLSELHYLSHEILAEKPKMNGMPSLRGGETLVVHLYDEITDFGADLYYTVYDDCSVIARRIVYKNHAKESVTLDRAYSFALTLPGGEYDMLTLYGGWAHERQQERTPVRRGISRIDSKRGSSSAAENPFLAVMTPDTTETHGEAYGFNLVYSSSFALTVDRVPYGHVLVTGGINDYDFSWLLEPGCELETPEVVIAYSDEGLGGMSRAFHDAYRNHLINPKHVRSSRPILINNWEATSFKFTYEKLCAIADAIAGTGVDTLVLDDGWFGKREDATSGLGDWVVNEEKLPGGLKGIIDYVHSKGMKFGLWFEPEMISEDSDIFRAHPEYAIGVPGRERCRGRYQYMMDLTKEEVRDYIVDSVNKVIRENEIDYVKWDFNRNMSEFYSIGREPERQMETAHRYALGLYDICERIVNANPDVFFEGCASGGARFDPGILYYFPQIWTSDNSDAEDRTTIQYGTSFAYPLSAMSCHVSECPNHQVGRTTPFSTRADIAHLGATGYELDTTVFTDEDRDMVRAQIKDYLEKEDLVLNGDLYRIDNPKYSNYFSFAVVAKDKKNAFLTCYRRLHKRNIGVHTVRMAGLDPKKKYFVPELGIILEGSTIMNAGIIPTFKPEDFTSVVYHFEEK